MKSCSNPIDLWIYSKMCDIKLKEGRLAFHFQGVKLATQYDNWQHYRNQYSSACGSSKAVDFIVCKNREVWLIEVKDYRRNKRSKKMDLAEEVALKVRDTLAGLVSAQFLATNAQERSDAKAALSQRKLCVALHLQQPKNPSRLFPRVYNPANLTLKLKQQLRFIDPHTRLIDTTDFPTSLGSVKSI